MPHPDATAYATWRGGSLPSEAQWEYAARGGLDGRAFVWGDEAIALKHANVWQGEFPTRNTRGDGFAGTAPVGSFPPNGLGLFDMAGNVWEWTADQYRHDLYRDRAAADVTTNPMGPSETRDPRNPHATDTRVHRGGSFLCHASYCSSYRPAARMATTPDSALSHLGMRVVFSRPQADALAGAESIAAADGQQGLSGPNAN
jgi:sulfatase modifying factor 1